ncbi:response regulator transcription factor [Nitrosococcus wardiae]|uniref:Response regulator transcription factor n=1 Tax=Nitrosococcus wardiae TaxID=1814290 RepID=A0A4P7BXP8_9GAMM|nr:LuxR C-terminal-related transcriptional regulator [Nitrosococcus wardiae]QBQ53166.1 response regulator transcription factor [Nitrosococcus wardiae]
MNSEIHQAVVFVVDDDEAVRDSLRWVIEAAGFKVKAYPSAGEFLKKLDPSQSGCLVLDVRMPEMNGLHMKPFDNQILLERIERSIELDRKRRETKQKQEEIAHRVAHLTSRERQVMNLIVKGKPNKVVAVELGISTKTVEIHRARVMEKLEAKNLADLIHLAHFLEDTNKEPVLR